MSEFGNDEKNQSDTPAVTAINGTNGHDSR